MTIETGPGPAREAAVLIVCGGKRGKCQKPLAVVERWRDDNPEHPTVFVLFPARGGLYRPRKVPDDFTGVNDVLPPCPQHHSVRIDGSNPRPFPHELLRQPIREFQRSGERQTFRWEPPTPRITSM